MGNYCDHFGTLSLKKTFDPLLGNAKKSVNHNEFHQIDHLMLLGMPLQTTNMKVALLKLNTITVHHDGFILLRI